MNNGTGLRVIIFVLKNANILPLDDIPHDSDSAWKNNFLELIKTIILTPVGQLQM